MLELLGIRRYYFVDDLVDCSGVRDLLRLLFFVNGREVLATLKCEVVKILQHLAGNRAHLHQVSRHRHTLHRDGRLFNFQASSFQPAHQFALHKVGNALGIFCRARRFFELISQ